MNGAQCHKLTKHRWLQIIDFLANIDDGSHPHLTERLNSCWSLGGER